MYHYTGQAERSPRSPSGSEFRNRYTFPMWAPLWLPAVGLAYAAYAAAWPSARIWGPSIHRLAGRNGEVALTFDDGPSNETVRFLEALDELEVPATFFVCGRNVERRPHIALAIAKAGHAIGNHTYSHPRLTFCSYARVHREIARTQEAVAEATSVRPTLFRPPYGLRSPALQRVLPKLGLHGVHWSVAGQDWKRDSGQIADRILRRAKVGSIVCLHDGQERREPRRTDRRRSKPCAEPFRC